ncbi:MAG: sigma-70 family RNA polymerase sigma factor [Clostridia bacterium]|nr:sigma-70 family RNA polymerase sigma factor [Clostridia bacterium]
MKDDQIVALFWERSQDAITESEAKYGNYCHAIAYNILSLREDAEECVNDTWLAAWQSIPPQKPKLLSSFFGKITRNLAIDRLSFVLAKKRKGQALTLLEELAETLPSHASEDVMVDEILLKDSLNSFLRTLPQETRNIFLQRYFYCRDVKAIAEEFSLPENNVSVILYRTRKALKTYLEERGVAL